MIIRIIIIIIIIFEMSIYITRERVTSNKVSSLGGGRGGLNYLRAHIH